MDIVVLYTPSISITVPDPNLLQTNDYSPLRWAACNAEWWTDASFTKYSRPFVPTRTSLYCTVKSLYI